MINMSHGVSKKNEEKTNLICSGCHGVSNFETPIYSLYHISVHKLFKILNSPQQELGGNGNKCIPGLKKMPQMKSEFWLSHVVTYLKSVAIELDKKILWAPLSSLH